MSDEIVCPNCGGVERQLGCASCNSDKMRITYNTLEHTMMLKCAICNKPVLLLENIIINGLQENQHHTHSDMTH
jgi:hypothetical protein